MTDLLKKELETYLANKHRLIASAEGKFVLIHGNEVSGTFNSQLDAINEGYRKFGNVPFLVHQIQKIEIPENFVSNNLAF